MFDLDKAIVSEYSGQTGYGSLPYFLGKQYGSGWMRNIARMAFPFLRKAMGVVGNVAANTAEDLINDKDKKFGATLKEHTINAVKGGFRKQQPKPSASSKVKRRATTINRTAKRRKIIV